MKFWALTFAFVSLLGETHGAVVKRDNAAPATSDSYDFVSSQNLTNSI